MQNKDIKLINVLALKKIKPFVYENYLTWLEMLTDLCKKLNETILIVNSMEEIVSTIDTNFTDIKNDITSINNKLEQIYTDLNNFETRINNNVDIKIQEAYNEVILLMNNYQTIFNQSLNSLKNDLEQQIANIELGNVRAYDPTTGEFENVSTVIMNIYDALRQNSITAQEFDNLELTATVYDNREISAYNFDINGKTFLLV